MKKLNRILSVAAISLSFVIVAGCFLFFLIKGKTTNTKDVNAEISKLKELPKPEITGGARGELGIDKNINEATIDEYLNREDSVYRDMRMLEDPGNYEAIGGDRFLSGYVEGFEVIPLPYIIPVKGLPSEVGDTYTGNTLFYDDNGTYIANYEESMNIIEQVFPKDKVIFLMCGGGGYSGMTKNFLVSLGWDENKIYNTGGYWYYKGEHSINVKKEVDGVVSYDFDSVPYHRIEFDKLTKTANYKSPKTKVTELKISTTKFELEQGTSFQLNVIVLPNDATNKEVKWESSNESIATVTPDGLVKAIGEGNATITANATDGGKTVSCVVNVKKKETGEHIILDDVSSEANELALYDFDKIMQEFDNITQNSDGSLKKEYSDSEGRANELCRKVYDEYNKKNEKAVENKTKIFNKLFDEKKTFVLLMKTKVCEGREYLVSEEAEKILKQNNYSYIKLGEISGFDGIVLEKSKMNEQKLRGGSIAIVKDGDIYEVLDPEVDTLKSDEETKNWFSRIGIHLK